MSDYYRSLDDKTILIGACYKCPLEKPKDDCALEEIKCESYKEAFNKIQNLTPKEQAILAHRCRQCMKESE